MERNYFSGIVGGILGGIICSIPWVLVYVYGNMMFSALALIIGIGVLKGYQLFKGKMSKGLPFIIYAISIIVILLQTFVFVPLLIMVKYDYSFSIESIREFYRLIEMGDFIKDVVFSLLFTILGVSGVAASVKNQLNGNPNQTIKYKGETQVDINEVRDFFVTNNAMSVENSIVVDYSSGLDQNAFLQLKDEGIIKEFNGAYYYSLADEARVNGEKEIAREKNKKNKTIIFVVAACVTLALCLVAILLGGKSSGDGLTLAVGDNVKLVYDKMMSYEKDPDEDKTWYMYYDEDQDLEKGYITISYFNDGGYVYEEGNADAFKAIFEEYSDVEVISSTHQTTNNKLDYVEVVMHIAGTDDDGDYDYYEIIDMIYINNNMLYVETNANTISDCNSLLDDSGILENINY